jgi:hypothetical protein
MSDVKPVCPKCGGEMVEGTVRYTTERAAAQPTMPTVGFSMEGFGRMVDSVTNSTFWEEKTGGRTGLIFKRDETRKMRLNGHRCTLCGYVELYAEE